MLAMAAKTNAPRYCSDVEMSMHLGNSTRYPRELARAFVQAAIGFDKIGQTLSRRLCTSGIPQYPRPFAAGLGVCDPRIGRAEDNDAEWLRFHLRCVVRKAKSRLGILERAIEALPSHDDSEN
jgi:hypothetical protein